MVQGKGPRRSVRDRKPRGFFDERDYTSRVKDALNVFETRQITDRIRLQNVWCSFIKQPRQSDVPIIEAYAILRLHNPDVFACRVWTYKDDVIKSIDPDNITDTLSQQQQNERLKQMPDFITQARYDITPVSTWAVSQLSTL